MFQKNQIYEKEEIFKHLTKNGDLPRRVGEIILEDEKQTKSRSWN